MHFCENVVTLDSVHKSHEVVHHADGKFPADASNPVVFEKIQLVMKLAPDGSLLKFLMDGGSKLNEDQVRTIME